MKKCLVFGKVGVILLQTNALLLRYYLKHLMNRANFAVIRHNSRFFFLVT